MNQTPEPKLNIGPALTPQVLSSPTETQISKETTTTQGSANIKPALTIDPAPVAQIPEIKPAAPTPEIYPPLETAPQVSMPTPVPAPIEPLPSAETTHIVNKEESGGSVQAKQVQNKPMTLEDNLNLVRSNLYISELTPEIEDLIIKYVDAYHTTLDYCLKTPMPEEAKVKELELLSGPINEIYNPNNSRLFDGNNYPAVELILNKVDEYAQGLEKGFTRMRVPANASAPQSTEQQPILNTFGYLSVLFIFIASVVFSIALGYLLFILKK